MNRSVAEIARLFSLDPINEEFAEQCYPGRKGLVIADGRLRSMVWGFPLARTSAKTGKPLKPKPVNNARSEKLSTFFWRDSFETRRCLIPLTAWAEAEGARGSMTRTWLSVADTDAFTVAGIWRDSAEWGPSYSMVMVDSKGPAAEIHNRMPAIIASDDRERWITGTPDEARSLCRPFAGELSIDRTSQPWAG